MTSKNGTVSWWRNLLRSDGSVVVLTVEIDGELESKGGDSGSREGLGLRERLCERERLAILSGCFLGGLGAWYWAPKGVVDCD